MSRKLLFILLIFSCTFTGCMSAQYFRDRRIAENQQMFDSFTPEIRKKISVGQIDIGFTEDMVRIAWGKPDHVFIRTTKNERSTVWIYTGTRFSSQTDRVTVPVTVYDDRGQGSIVYRDAWFDRDREEEYDRARVEFIEGIVTAVEQISPQ